MNFTFPTTPTDAGEANQRKHRHVDRVIANAKVCLVGDAGSYMQELAAMLIIALEEREALGITRGLSVPGPKERHRVWKEFLTERGMQ